MFGLFSPNKQIQENHWGFFFGEKIGDIDIVNTSTIHTASFQNGALVQAAAVVTAPASLGGAILWEGFEGKAGWVCLRSVSNKQLVHLKKPLRLVFRLQVKNFS